jgi:hypothetical protein
MVRYGLTEEVNTARNGWINPPPRPYPPAAGWDNVRPQTGESVRPGAACDDHQGRR